MNVVAMTIVVIAINLAVEHFQMEITFQSALIVKFNLGADTFFFFPNKETEPCLHYHSIKNT